MHDGVCSSQHRHISGRTLNARFRLPIQPVDATSKL